MKRILSIFIVLLSLCLPVTSFAICGPAPTPGGDWVFPGGFCDNILLVCPTSEYTTIGAAMNAADAWDTVLVAEGTYNEAVVFPHDNITLRSQGSAENTIITQAAGTTVSLGTTSGCTLDGFTVTLSAATATGDEVIFSNNNDADDYNIVENCIIDVENKAGESFGLYGINIDDGNFALLNNRITVTQTGDGGVYAIWNSAAHKFECRGNTIVLDQDSVGAYMTSVIAHAAGAGGILYAVQNTITTDSEHTGGSIGYSVYAHANINYVNENIINAVGAAGEMCGVYTGAGDTAYYNSNFINVTTTDGDGDWALFSAGTSYAHGNNIIGDGVLTTGGTIYEGVNQINATLSIDGIVYNWPTDNGDAGEQLQTDGAGGLTWESSGGLTDDSVGSIHINWAEPITVPLDNRLQFHDSGMYIFADDDSILDVVADGQIDFIVPIGSFSANLKAVTYGAAATVTDAVLTHMSDVTSPIQAQFALKTTGDATYSTDNSVATFNGTGYILQDTDVTIIGGAIDNVASMNMDAQATPYATNLDSDCPGTDKEISRAGGNFLSGADGAENGSYTIEAMFAGSEIQVGYWDSDAETWIWGDAGTGEDLQWDFSTPGTITVTSPGGGTAIDFSALNLATTGTISGRIPVGDDAVNNTITKAEMNSIIYADDNDTWVLDDIDAADGTGWSVCVYQSTAAITTIDPDDEDMIRDTMDDGGLETAGELIASTAVAGSMICLVVTDFTGDVAHWSVMSENGTWTPAD